MRLGICVCGPKGAHNLGGKRLERSLGVGEPFVAEQPSKPGPKHMIVGVDIGKGRHLLHISWHGP